MGRWRLEPTGGAQRWSSGQAGISDPTGRAFGAGGTGAAGRWSLRQQRGVEPFTSDDPDSERIWWTDAGVHQNLTFPVQPDPVSGMHCWLQTRHRRPGRSRRPLRRRRRRHRPLHRALPAVAGQGPTRPRSRRPPPPAVAGPPGQAGGHGLPGAGRLARRPPVRSAGALGRAAWLHRAIRSDCPLMADRAATVAARSAMNVEGGLGGTAGRNRWIEPCGPARTDGRAHLHDGPRPWPRHRRGGGSTSSTPDGRSASSLTPTSPPAPSCSTSVPAPAPSPTRSSAAARGWWRSRSTRAGPGSCGSGSATPSSWCRPTRPTSGSPASPYDVVANPPFGITTALLRRLLQPGSRLRTARLILPGARRPTVGRPRRARPRPLEPHLRRRARRPHAPPRLPTAAAPRRPDPRHPPPRPGG